MEIKISVLFCNCPSSVHVVRLGTRSSCFPPSVSLCPNCQSLLVIMNLNVIKNLETKQLPIFLSWITMMSNSSWIILSLWRDCKDTLWNQWQTERKQQEIMYHIYIIANTLYLRIFTAYISIPLLQEMRNKKIASSMQIINTVFPLY